MRQITAAGTSICVLLQGERKNIRGGEVNWVTYFVFRGFSSFSVSNGRNFRGTPKPVDAQVSTYELFVIACGFLKGVGQTAWMRGGGGQTAQGHRKQETQERLTGRNK